jgi:SNF2 family DNA or RNA helicase
MQGDNMKNYQFKTKPYDHQKEIWEKSWFEPYYALFAEMGTGKSKIAIDTIGALYLTGQIDTALVLAPKGVFDNWVKGEFPTHLPENIEYKIVRWQPNWTKKYTAEIKEVAIRGDSKALNILVMNIEALSTAKGAASAKRFLERNPDNLTLIDESTTIKNRQAQRTKTVLDLTRVSKFRRILTGSPITKSPMDLYAQCAFLSPEALGFKSFYAFQGRYAVIQRRNMGHRSFQHIVGYRKLEELSEKLDKFSVRVLKSECLDLPDKVYTKRDVPLTPEQTKVYNEMKELALAQLEDGKLSTTASVLTQIMRLQQITCGFLQPDDGPIQALKNNRMPELMNVIEEAQGKVIIWATWTHDIIEISTALSTAYGEDSVAAYYGETPQDERQKIVNRFQDPDSPLRFFVGQPRTGGYGITLTAAHTMVYYSNSYDLEIRLQSEDRAHRIGQTKSVTYVDLISPGTIDETILTALRNKINIASAVLGEDVKDWLR